MTGDYIAAAQTVKKREQSVQIESGYTVFVKKHSISLALKRFFDIFLCTLSLILLFPVFAVCFVAIKLSSKGSAFYVHERVGKNFKPFNMLKFRTMHEGSDDDNLPRREIRGEDSRITFVGKILRRLKLDELPQIINIICGDMSIIGPRPLLKRHIEMYSSDKLCRYYVRPGLSGLAQVNGSVHLSFEEKALYDAIYIRKFSLFLDIKIILKTFLVVLFGEKRFSKKPYSK